MFRTSKMTRMLAVGLLAVGLVGGSACSSDDSEDGTDRTTTSVDDGTDVTTGTEESSEATDTETTDPNDPEDTGPSDDPQDYIDKLAADISAGAVASQEQGECIGERWVDVIGFDAIGAAGMSPSEFSNLDTESYQKLGLSDADAESMYDAFEGCGIAVADSIRAAFGEGLSATQQSCIDDELTDELVKDLYITNLLEGNDPSDGRTDALEACATQ